LSSINLLWQSLDSFENVLKKQMTYVDRVALGFRPVVIGCEHDTVITFGKRSQNFNDLLIPLQELRAKNIEIFTIDRGGHATLHNPGQLVLYPIIPLRDLGLGVRVYVELLEISTALFLAEHGLEVTRAYEPGLWVNDKKIAAFGIRVDRGVSLHGLAINVFNDLEPFSHIKQCGAIARVTNMETEMKAFMDRAPEFHLEDMARRWTQIFETQLKEHLKEHKRGHLKGAVEDSKSQGGEKSTQETAAPQAASADRSDGSNISDSRKKPRWQQWRS
jgi:lipoate-protein ligase B